MFIISIFTFKKSVEKESSLFDNERLDLSPRDHSKNNTGLLSLIPMLFGILLVYMIIKSQKLNSKLQTYW